jgi:hypothetical protein
MNPCFLKYRVKFKLASIGVFLNENISQNYELHIKLSRKRTIIENICSGSKVEIILYLFCIDFNGTIISSLMNNVETAIMVKITHRNVA